MNLRLTALRTLLSRGFLLGSLVEERIPVPQLLAKVFDCLLLPAGLGYCALVCVCACADRLY